MIAYHKTGVPRCVSFNTAVSVPNGGIACHWDWVWSGLLCS